MAAVFAVISPVAKTIGAGGSDERNGGKLNATAPGMKVFGIGFFPWFNLKFGETMGETRILIRRRFL